MKKTKLFKIGEHSEYPHIRATRTQDNKYINLKIDCYEWIDRQGNVSKTPKYSFETNSPETVMSELCQITTIYYASKIVTWLEQA